MSTTTTYYEFIKPEGTDLVNPLVDNNPNWDALDADLHEFNERSIANCTEIVTLGVHAISRLDTTAKFLKWIATANFTAGETFTVDGLAVAAYTPAGATIATGAYVTGSVVLACLNADNTAMTVFVSGTTVASDAERLGGELPAYYSKQLDMTTAENNITNLQNKMGNTSIVGIGDGTATGAISALNADLINVKNEVANMMFNFIIQKVPSTGFSIDISNLDNTHYLVMSTGSGLTSGSGNVHKELISTIKGGSTITLAIGNQAVTISCTATGILTVSAPDNYNNMGFSVLETIS